MRSFDVSTILVLAHFATNKAMTVHGHWVPSGDGMVYTPLENS